MRSHLLRLVIALFAVASVLTGCGGSSNNAPQGAAVSYYYIADTGNNRIVRFASFATPTGFISYGTSGSGQGELSSTSDVAFDGSGNIYIADTGNNRIVRIDSTFSGSGWKS